MARLNHPKVKKLTRRIAIRLGLDPVFVGFVFSRSRPECFQYWLEDPRQGWTCYVADEADVAYPLWSCNADQTLVCVSGDRKWFTKAYHDDADTEDVAITVQGLLADLFLSMYDSNSTIEELEEAAAACGFRFLDRLLEFVGRDDDIADWEECVRQFIRQIDEDSSS